MTKINFYDLDKSIRDKQCHEWLRNRITLMDSASFAQPLSTIGEASIAYGLSEGYLIPIESLGFTARYKVTKFGKAKFSTISG